MAFLLLVCICVQTKAYDRNTGMASQGVLTIALSGPENHVMVRLLLAFSPHRCQYGSRRFDLNGRFLTMRRRELWDATTR
jgi:hypothetical protein